MTLTLSHLSWRPRAVLALAASLLLVATAMLAHGAPTLLAHTSSSSPAPTPASLASVARTDPTRSVEAIVQFANRVKWERGPQLVRMYGGTVTRDLHIINGYGVKMTAGAAQRMSATPGVLGVTLNTAVKTSDQGVSDVSDDSVGPDSSTNSWGSGDCNAQSPSWLSTDVCDVHTSFLQSTRTTKLWQQADPQGSGKGIGVAVVDTGIAGGLPDFQKPNGNSRVIASAVTNPDATTEDDTYGHGTHVAGLIAGNGSTRPDGDPLQGEYLGAAPKANLISVKVSDDQGNTSLIDVIYGLQFVVDHQADYNIRVVNLSLDSQDPESYTTDPLDAAAEAAWFHGIVVVAAAGNLGTADDAVDYAPGNDPYVISVGSVDDLGTKRTSDDTITDWSSRGTTQDGFAKPDVVAPGAHIVSTYAPNSAFGTLCPDCIVDGQYFRVGGTSMSAAIVSGIAADLLDDHPNWTPDKVKGALTHQLRHIVGGNIEVDAQHADKASGNDLVSNQGLTPNSLIDPATGNIDYTRASWSRASWSGVTGSRASWSRASWSRASWSRASWSCDCALMATAPGVDPSRASWSRASWSRASWSRASWSSSFAK